MIRRTLVGVVRPLSSRAAEGDAVELVVEAGCSRNQIGAHIARHGRTCLAVIGDETAAETERSLFELRKVGINCAVLTARGAYPTTDGIDEARALARRVGAGSIIGMGTGGALDTAKAAARLHTSSGPCKRFLSSPSGVLMAAEEGGRKEPQRPAGHALPLVMVPTAAGAGAAANTRCLVWHPEDEVTVPMAEAQEPTFVALLDPTLCTSLSRPQTVAMALTALSSCVDALLASEVASSGTELRPQGTAALQEISLRGIGYIAEGLPAVLADGRSVSARKMLTQGSVCAGQVASSTPAPPTQLVSRAAGSLLCRQSYPEVCAMVFPRVISHLLDQAQSFSADTQVAKRIETALSRAGDALLPDGGNGEALLTWLENQQREWSSFAALSDLDSCVTAEEVATNLEMLIALEEDTDTADKLWSGRRASEIATLVVG